MGEVNFDPSAFLNKIRDYGVDVRMIASELTKVLDYLKKNYQISADDLAVLNNFISNYEDLSDRERANLYDNLVVALEKILRSRKTSLPGAGGTITTVLDRQ